MPQASSATSNYRDPKSAYQALAEQGQVQADTAQMAVLEHLQALHAALAAPTKKGFLRRKAPVAAPQSLYIWGPVGRGKSMLMDVFFQTAPLREKKRLHFHEFMQQIHSGLHAIRSNPVKSREGGDPVALLVKELAADLKLLCFDELQATDVADATLLFRLFERLFEAGVIIVATSNRPPKDIYTGGVQRERFDKFVALLEDKMQVESLVSETDYRSQKAENSQRLRYHSPLGQSAEAFIAGELAALAPNKSANHIHLKIHGRSVPMLVYGEKIGRASFRDLCENPLGPADYLAIASRLQWLIFSDIPALSPAKRNEAKRLVTLIDTLYENKVKLVCTAAVELDTLYSAGDGSFEFKRTVSRLKEMVSE